MNDLVCVAADKQIKATIEELLRRPRSLGIRPIQAELLLHPEHDPGCYVRPAEILRGYRQVAAHALIILDHDWDGVPTTSGADLEALIEEKLEREGMADWAVPVVIDPELEAWVSSASPHVPDVLGWKGAWSAFRKELGRPESVDSRRSQARRPEGDARTRTPGDREEPFGVALPQARE